jgi:hypothetical protein
VDELRVVKYLEGYEDGAEKREKQHSLADLVVNVPDSDAAEEEDSEESSSAESGDDNPVDDETILPKQTFPSGETAVPRSSLLGVEIAVFGNSRRRASCGQGGIYAGRGC